MYARLYRVISCNPPGFVRVHTSNRSCPPPRFADKKCRSETIRVSGGCDFAGPRLGISCAKRYHICGRLERTRRPGTADALAIPTDGNHFAGEIESESR